MTSSKNLMNMIATEAAEQIAARERETPTVREMTMTDEECSLWYCEECKQSGALFVHHADVYSVVSALDRAHRAKSPKCEALVGRLRIARPNSWYADLHKR